MGYIKKAEKVVYDLLVKYPDLRDDYHRLVSNVYAIYVTEHNKKTFPKIVTWEDYLHWFCDPKTKKKIPAVGSIERCSRKLQEETPALRGKLWAKRRNKQDDVKAELGYTP